MFKVFKKIRQKLIIEKRLSNYLIYAIGEIILVVIGILIALAINNANVERIIRNKEKVYLSGLKDEFQTSKHKLAELIAVNQQSYKAAVEIIGYISARNDTLSEQRFSELLYNSLSYDISFNPNNSLLNEMISSGILKDIRKTELRISLTNWISTLEDIAKQEEELAKQREKVLDMFRSNKFSIRSILDQTGVNRELGLPYTPGDISNLGILNSLEFENNLLLYLLASSATETAHYEPLMYDLNRILDLLNSELEN